MDEARVVLRAFDKDRDQAFIYGTWRNSSYHSAEVKPEEIPKIFFSQMTKKIRETLDVAQVKIACLSDDPQLIIGYSIARGDHLDFIYVKDDYREKGIGQMLMPKDIKTVTKHLTKIGKILVDKKNLTKEI